MGDCLQVDKPP